MTKRLQRTRLVLMGEGYAVIFAMQWFGRSWKQHTACEELTFWLKASQTFRPTRRKSSSISCFIMTHVYSNKPSFGETKPSTSNTTTTTCTGKRNAKLAGPTVVEVLKLTASMTGQSMGCFSVAPGYTAFHYYRASHQN